MSKEGLYPKNCKFCETEVTSIQGELGGEGAKWSKKIYESDA